MVQRRAARFLKGVKRYDREVSITNLLINLKWPSLAERRKNKRLKILSAIVFGSHPALKTLRVVEAPQRIGHHPRTLLRPQTKINLRVNYFLPRTIRKWNIMIRELPENPAEKDIPSHPSKT